MLKNKTGACGGKAGACGGKTGACVKVLPCVIPDSRFFIN